MEKTHKEWRTKQEKWGDRGKMLRLKQDVLYTCMKMPKSKFNQQKEKREKEKGKEVS